MYKKRKQVSGIGDNGGIKNQGDEFIELNTNLKLSTICYLFDPVLR